MTLSPFDVVVVPFPYSDALAEKRRPAIVVSNPALEAERGLVWLAMVTSTSGALIRGDALIEDLNAAGLTTPCRVRAAKLATLDTERVLRRVGALAADDVSGVQAALRACAAF